MDKVQIYSVTKVADAKSKYRIKWKVNARHHTRAFPTKARAENYIRRMTLASNSPLIVENQKTGAEVEKLSRN